MASDLPPAYNSLHTSTVNIADADESVPNCDDGSEFLVNSSFEDKTTRIGFIQKVLTIKLLQMILMAIVIGIFVATQWELKWAMRRGAEVHLFILSTLALLITIGLLIYCNKARHENPFKYVFLITYPLSITFFISFPAVRLDFINSLAVAFLTYIVAYFCVLLYTVFSLQTKLVFAAKYAIVLAVITQLLTYAVSVPFIYVDAFIVLYIGLALCLDYIYVFWDLEMMTSKKYWFDITPGQFVDGALNLQLDYYFIMINVIGPQARKYAGITVGPQNH